LSSPGEPTSFGVIAERSAVLIRARSNVGPIEFGTTSVAGTITVDAAGGRVTDPHGAAALLDVEIATLRSGNSLYDAELAHRLDARLFPTAAVELETASRLGEDRFDVTGSLTLHGVTAMLDGVVAVAFPSDGKLIVTGDQTVDIRDFDIAAPTMLMLKIYPDVRVYLHLEAEAIHGGN
jgi:polyisoprenoid-binding protein YceI